MKKFRVLKSRKHKNRSCLISLELSNNKELETLICCYPHDCSPIKYDSIHVMNHEISELVNYLVSKGWEQSFKRMNDF